MTFIEKEGLRYYQFDIFKGLPLFHAVLTRQGGCSKSPYDSLNFGGTVGDNPDTVLRNHQKTYKVLGFDYYSRYDVWQVHGKNIQCVTKPRGPNERHQKADGILTDASDVTLFMRFADCVPILLADPVKRIIGIVHAGWQGTALKITEEAILKMQESYGSIPKDIVAGIGPSICQSCYEVGEEVYTAFVKSFGNAADSYFLRENGHLHLDLWEANRKSLEATGVKQIEIAGLCTACHLEDWYSHRGEAGKTGRFGVLMSLSRD